MSNRCRDVPSGGAASPPRRTRAGSRRSRRRGRRAPRARTPVARRRRRAARAAFSIRRSHAGPSRSPSPPPTHHELDVEQGHRRADRDAERVDRLVEQLARDAVAGLEGAQPDAARQALPPPLALEVEENRLALPRLAPGARLERAAARVGLDAAAQPAVAAPPAGLHADVADLAGRAAPVHEPPVEHEPAADTRPPEDTEERLRAAPRAEAALRLDGGVDVVADRRPGRPSRSASTGPSANGSSQPSMFGTFTTTPARRRRSPARPTPTPASSATRTPAEVAASRDGDRDVPRDLGRAAARRRGPRRAARATFPSSSVTTAWIFVPPTRHRPAGAASSKAPDELVERTAVRAGAPLGRRCGRRCRGRAPGRRR